ncbi:hypothetical protein H5201_21115 [Pseudoalteromonas sp. SG43-6]|uniref:hypothetical protein n=1 Tax=Pseudoalteromonas sp. SG43-6 TaxID=2760967 RepID=UPI0015FF38DB|nr:hypothetical protein [Pseudoalteromonas sp. SG43-6]MBB1436756.1 hypothetical protein [Pseudoalteromonas sp. SG43-6]
MKFYFFTSELKNNSSVLLAFRRLFEICSNDRDGSFFDSEFTHYLKTRKLIKSKEITHVVVPTFFSVILLRCLLLGLKIKIVYWVQGDVPSESFLKNSSKVRFYILKFLELIALKMSDSCIYVSDYMKRYYDRLVFKKSVVLPCISTLKKVDSVVRRKSSYCYIGGMSEWQKLDWMLQYMNSVFHIDNLASLKIATRDKLKATELVSHFIDERYFARVTVVSLSNENEVEEFLSGVEFGFLLREESNVNYVSSPIKLAEYLSCGVNVLLSPSIKSYAEVVSNYGAGCIINSYLDVKITPYCESASLKLYGDFFSIQVLSQRVEALL